MERLNLLEQEILQLAQKVVHVDEVFQRLQNQGYRRDLIQTTLDSFMNHNLIVYTVDLEIKIVEDLK